MKSLAKDESGVAYLILVGIVLTIVIVGVAFMFTSDFVDYIDTGINDYSGTPLENSMDADSQQTGDLLYAVFKFFLILALIIIMYWSYTMSQKPVRPF